MPAVTVYRWNGLQLEANVVCRIYQRFDVVEFSAYENQSRGCAATLKLNRGQSGNGLRAELLHMVRNFLIAHNAL